MDPITWSGTPISASSVMIVWRKSWNLRPGSFAVSRRLRQAVSHFWIGRVPRAGPPALRRCRSHCTRCTPNNSLRGSPEETGSCRRWSVPRQGSGGKFPGQPSCPAGRGQPWRQRRSPGSFPPPPRGPTEHVCQIPHESRVSSVQASNHPWPRLALDFGELEQFGKFAVFELHC